MDDEVVTAAVITVLPGVPGMPNLRVDDDRTPYPDTTVDMVKVLRALGFDVRFTEPREDRVYVGHKAYEVWLPILVLTSELLLGVEAGLLVEFIKSYFDNDPPSDALLHVDWRVETADGHEERLQIDGEADAVLEALEVFERRVRKL